MINGGSRDPAFPRGIAGDTAAAFEKTEGGLWIPSSPFSVEDYRSLQRAPFIISEIESSLAFVNVEFVVCTALLLFNTKSLMKVPLTGLALFTAFVFFLFGGLCFAVAGGEVARGPRGIRAAGTALEWGNVLSEWFGLYMLLLSMPVVVQILTKSSVVGGIAVAITGAGYLVYVSSGYDLLSRFASGKLRVLVHIFFAATAGLHWLGVAIKCSWLYYSAGGLFIAGAFICASLHKLRGEFSSRKELSTGI